MLRPDLQIAQSAPRGCPFCLTGGIDVLANFHDTLAAYRCPRCAGVFYTIASQTVSRGPQVTHLLQRPPRRYQRGRPLRAPTAAAAFAASRDITEA
jgi:hypothetical protein